MKFRIKGAARILEFVTNGKYKAAKKPDPMKHVGRFRMRCNLCNRVFRTTSPYYRFCKACRNEDEAFRFAEWLGV